MGQQEHSHKGAPLTHTVLAWPWPIPGRGLSPRRPSRLAPRGSFLLGTWCQDHSCHQRRMGPKIWDSWVLALMIRHLHYGGQVGQGPPQQEGGQGPPRTPRLCRKLQVVQGSWRPGRVRGLPLGTRLIARAEHRGESAPATNFRSWPTYFGSRDSSIGSRLGRRTHGS